MKIKTQDSIWAGLPFEERRGAKRAAVAAGQVYAQRSFWVFAILGAILMLGSLYGSTQIARLIFTVLSNCAWLLVAMHIPVVVVLRHQLKKLNVD